MQCGRIAVWAGCSVGLLRCGGFAVNKSRGVGELQRAAITRPLIHCVFGFFHVSAFIPPKKY